MATTTVPVAAEPTTGVTWERIAGAIGEVGATLGTLREAAFSTEIETVESVVEPLRPFVLERRSIWHADKAGRDVNSYTAAMFIKAAGEASKAWRNYRDPKTAAGKAAERLVNFAMLHTAATEEAFRASDNEWSFDTYCDWLPQAWRYTSSGVLTRAEAAKDKNAAAVREVIAEHKASTTMSADVIASLPAIRNAKSAADKLYAARCAYEDAKALYLRLKDAASDDVKTAANKAYTAAFDAKTKAAIAKDLKAQNLKSAKYTG